MIKKISLNAHPYTEESEFRQCISEEEYRGDLCHNKNQLKLSINKANEHVVNFSASHMDAGAESYKFLNMNDVLNLASHKIYTVSTVSR